MPVEYWNPVPIYYSDVPKDQFEKIYKEVAKSIKNEMFSESEWGDLVKTTNKVSTNIVKTLNLCELESLIMFHFNQFTNMLNIDKNFYLIDSWFNKLPKFGHQGLHIHTQKDDLGTNKIYSGVYFYENTTVELEPIIFHIKNEINTQVVKYDYKPGRILIFSGLLPHKVNFNKTDIERTSFSFNIQLV